MLSNEVINLEPILSAISGYFSAPPEQIESRRLFHGRGKCYPGLDWLSADVHPGILLVTVFNPSQENEALICDDFEGIVASLQTEVIELFASLKALNGFAFVIQRRDLAGAPFSVLKGVLPNNPLAIRNNAKYELTFAQQNIGYFLDIEPARIWLETHAKHANVLNLFSYTCTFSVVAMLAGADAVVNFDLSKKSLEKGRENHKINNALTPNVRFFPHDILKSWGKIRKYGPYDVIVIDPPSFQKGSFIARKDYRKVLVKMDELLSENGRFLACLNAPEIAEAEFKEWVEEACPNFFCESSLALSEDFPERDDGKGLKMLAYTRV